MHISQAGERPLMGSARELDPFDRGPAHVALDARKLCLLDHGAHRECTAR